jgi:lipopolysaccharide export system protein LptC
MLYLYGHVEVNALTADSQLRKITTDNAQINLVTQDVTSMIWSRCMAQHLIPAA